ncbi:MAG: signal peptide peptidase SppA [Bacteroidetes bacterium]|nr:MAG: signal peptide peptidase SppA [Bacteroidota bacterium]
MKQFFKFTFASMLGMFLAFILIFLLFIGIISVSVSLVDTKKTIQVSSKSVLHIKLNHKIPDRTIDNPFQNFDFGSMSPKKTVGLNDILENIEKARTDENIKGIYLDISSIPTGLATIGEIRNALKTFKEDSGKFIICYSEMYSQRAYYLASVADKIYLNPEGYVEFKGMSTTIPFFKDALEKLEIEAQIIRHGKFKSAVEPFMLDKMSEANREQTMTYVGSIWNHLLNDISESRNIPFDELNRIADNLLIASAEDAVKYKIADQLMFKDEVLADLRERLELEEDDKINFMSLGKYTNAPKEKKKGVIRDKIAVVYASGGIVSGEGDPDEIGSERISKAIRKARLDDKVKAIVLRINSGGGSALASDVIWREMVLAKEVKTVVASMGNVAASGGYYIACAADTIVANPITITGSIGVLGIIFNAQKFFSNKLGITFDGVKTNEHSDLGSMVRPLTEGEKRIIQDEIERIYDVFITHVAEDRELTKAEVDSIGQGRVWSGIDAKRIGLIDVFGGLETAIELAASMADIEDYRILELPKQKDPFEKFLQELTGEVQTTLLKHQLGDNYKYYKQLQALPKMNGIQARIPYEIEIR